MDVIWNQTIAVPGLDSTFQLRSQDPRGPYGQAMLSLVTGSFPTGPGQVAMTAGLVSELGLKLGDVWHEAGSARRIVGIVENPQSLLDEFALVTPGQVKAPTEVTVLFDAPGRSASSLGPNIDSRSAAQNSNVFNPETILLALVTIAMLLIALVSVGGFTVLAQRRLRSLGMLESIGATDRNVRLVVRANGVVVGVVGAVLGAVLGLVLWLAYRPHLESSAHHLIGPFALPWLVVALAVVLAVLATYFAASRPARSITKVPIVAALSGRPAPPRQVHRSALPGIVFLGIAFLLLGYSGSTSGGTGSGGTPELLLGLVALIPAVILLSPFCLSVLARLGRRTPIALRLALRDLARYRARSGSALAAISVGVLIAVLIAILAAARYGNVLDYAGPNLASNQLIVYTPNNGPGPGPVVSTTPAQMRASVQHMAASLNTDQVVALYDTSASLNHNAPGRNFTGQIYVATPALLRAFSIKDSQIDPNADFLTMRPGLSTVSNMQFTWSTGKGGGVTISPGQGPGPGQGAGGGQGNQTSGPCTRAGDCIANPPIQEIGALPSGTSAPNTVITEHAIDEYGLQSQLSLQGWLIITPQTITAAQIDSVRLAAASAGMTIETKNDQPSSSAVINWATLFGIVLALAILGMSVGLIRSETAAELRTLAATGASGRTRRTLTAATAGALGFMGALLGTVAGYVGVIGWIRNNSLNGGVAALANVPFRNLLVILVGMPLLAAAVGWLFAGREPPSIAHQPLE